MYSTVTDVRNALSPGGVGSAGTAASLDDPSITDAIIEADSVIDTYLGIGIRYTVPTEDIEQGEPPAPVTVAVAPVRFWSRNIAAYLATLTFRRGKDLPADDPVRLRYTDTMNILIAVRDRKAEAPLPAFQAPGTTSGEIFVQNPYDGHLFEPADFSLAPDFSSRRHDVWPG